MNETRIPPAYICFDSVESAKLMGLDSACGTPTQISPKMAVKDDVLTIEMPEFNATPKLGGVKDMAGVKVFIRNNEPIVIAVYKDPEMTLLTEYCCGSGCCCSAHRCLC